MTVEEKMISMVDFDAFVQAVRVTIGDKDVELNMDLVHKYLEKWAEAKKDIFLLFGEKLFIEEEVDTEVNSEIMEGMISDLCKKYPAYAPLLDSIGSQEFAKNTILHSAGECIKSSPLRFYNQWVKGGKVSKVLSKIFQNPQFDIDLSVILQNRHIKAKSRVSIHPLDYATISTSGHDWHTCMEITGYKGGFNKSGCFSLMLDRCTVVAHLASPNQYTIKNDGGSFEWENKICRCLYLIDNDRKAFARGHCIGQIDSGTYKKWEDVLRSSIKSDAKWKSTDEFGYYSGYFNRAGAFYYDNAIKVKFYQDGEKEPENKKMTMGVSKLWCVVCGKEFGDIISHQGFLCCKSHVKGGKV